MSKRSIRNKRHIQKNGNPTKLTMKDNREVTKMNNMQVPMANEANQENQVCFLDGAILERDYSYQRPVDIKYVRKIVANFDPEIVNQVKVSYRDGHYYVFDGSHTLEALRIKFGTEHFPVLCKIYYGLSYEREAQLFAMQNGWSHQVAQGYKLRALALSGDKETMKFFNATKAGGFDIEPGKSTSRKGCINAVVKAQWCYKNLGEEEYIKMLRLIHDTWDGATWSVSQNMLRAMTFLTNIYGDMIKHDRFVKWVGKFETDRDLRLECNHECTETFMKYVWAIIRAYNQPGGSGALDRDMITWYQVRQEMINEKRRGVVYDDN